MASTHYDLLMFRDVLRKYKAEAEKLYSDYVQELADIPHIYHPDYVNSQRVTAKAHFEDNLHELQEKYCKQIESVKGDLIKQETNKDGSFISFDLLAKLNTIDQANVDLTQDEYLSLIAECVEVGSSICNRKLADIIKKKNMKSITFPTKENATELINSVANKCVSIIERYEGDTTAYSGSDYVRQRDLDGSWLEKLNADFNRVTTADIKHSAGDKLRSQLLEKIDVFEIDNAPSLAKQYVQDYNKKMMPDLKDLQDWRDSNKVSAFIPADED